MKSDTDFVKKIIVLVKKIVWNLGLHAFLIILFLVFLDVIFGGFIFYKYVFLVENQDAKVSGSILKFDEKKYQNILADLQRRNMSSEKAPAIEAVQPKIKNVK